MAISPDQGSAGGGDAATITDTNLGGAIAVRFDGRPAVRRHAGHVRRAVPHAAPARGILGAVQIAVTTTGGSATAPGTFVYIL
jgi:hypothetical protein